MTEIESRFQGGGNAVGVPASSEEFGDGVG